MFYVGIFIKAQLLLLKLDLFSVFEVTCRIFNHISMVYLKAFLNPDIQF